jgi:hypothetical protein
MGSAIRVVQRYLSKNKPEYHYKDLQLLVEEELTGTRGYGPVDYLVKYMQLAVMVNEAKHRDFDQGAAQNIVQMHSALEVRNLIIPLFIYG